MKVPSFGNSRIGRGSATVVTRRRLKRVQTLFGLFCVVFAAVGVTTIPTAQAAVGINHAINFQGKLTNPNGTNIANGNYVFVFSLYAASSGGAAIWTETDTLTLTEGIFQVNLGPSAAGANTNFANVDFNSDSLYMGIKVGADAEMTPRVQYTATPYAFNSEKLGGIAAAGFAQLNPASAQSGSLNVTGSVQAAVSLQAPLVDTATAVALNIGTVTASSVTIGRTTTPFTVQGTSASIFTATNGANTTTVSFTTPTAARAIAFPDAGGTLCTNTASTCSATYQTAGNYLAKNASDTSNFAVTATNYLYGFTNSSAAVASGVLKLDNGSNTNSTLSVTTSGNPVATQALILVNNTNGAASGNLLDLQVGGSSKFSVNSSGNVVTPGTITQNYSVATGDVLSVLATSATLSTARLVVIDHTATYTTTVTDSGNLLRANRAITTNTGGALTLSGSLATLSSNCTVTAGTCTDTANILSLTQSNASASGAVLNIANSGTGTGILLTGAATIASAAVTNLSISSGTTGILALDSGTTGAINIGTTSNAKTVTVGNTTGASSVVLSAGTGGITLGAITTLSALGTANTNSSICRNASNQLASCSGGSGAAFVQGGNSFTAAGDLGTNDNFDLNLRTNATTKLTVTAAGDVQFAQGSNRTLNIAQNTSNASGNSLSLAAGQGGAGNNSGGILSLDGGALTGSGLKGSVVVQGAGGNVGIGTTTPQQVLTVGSGGNIAQNMAAPGTLSPSTSTTGGTLAAATYYYKVTTLDAIGGETVASPEASITTTGATSTVTLTWTAIQGASSYRIYRGTAAGAENVYYTNTAASFTDTGAANTGGSPAAFTSAYVNKLSANGSSYILGGNVGIGTAAPNQALDVSGNVRVFDQSAAGISTLIVQSAASQAANDLVQFRNNGGTAISGINSTGFPFFVSGAFKGTQQTAALTAARTYTFPNSSGQFCLDSGNCNGAGSSLQTSYNNSIGGTTPEIKLDSTRSSLDIQDADTTIGANLLNIRAANGSGLGNILLSVDNAGSVSNKTSTGTVVFATDASGLAVSINGALQTLATSVASTPSNSLTVISGNATGATSASGDLRIDTGTATGTAGVIKIGDSNASSITIGRSTLGAIIPASSSLTLGTASSKIGAVLFKNGTNANTLTLQSGTTAANLTLTLPTADGSSGDCLTTNGSGGLTFGSCTSGIGALAANTALSNLANVAVNLTLIPGTVQAGTIDIGSGTLPWRYFYLSGTSVTPATMNFKITGAATGARTITLPDATGTVCLSTGNCSGTSATLQTDYTNSASGAVPEIKLDTTRTGVDIQDADTTLGSTVNLLAVRATNSSGLGNLLFSVNASGQTGINLGASTTPSADLSFGEGAARSLNVLTRTTNVSGNTLTVQGGNAGSGGSAVAGGGVLVQGGNAAGTTGNANGGDVTLFGGTKINSGADGNVILAHTGSAAKGRVGIGTSAPAVLLHVVGAAEIARFVGLGTTGIASQSFATFYDSNGTTRIGSVGDFSTADSDFYVQADTAKNLQLGAGAVTMLTLNAGANVVVGSATTDTTQVNFQLDSFSTFTDAGTCNTTTNQGAMYYNSSSNDIRSCTDGTWNDVITNKDLTLLTFGVVPDSGSNPGDLPALTTDGVSGPCKVSWASASTVTVQPCTAYSGGRRVKVASATLTITTTTTNPWQHLCLSGTDNQPALSAVAATAAANLPTFTITAPILCLADINNSGVSNTVIAALYDTRTFTTTIKEYATASVAALPIGSLVDSSSGSTAVIASVAASKRLYGTIVASNGSTSGTTPNIIVATLGPVYIKAIAGTAGDFMKASATSGFVDTITAIPNNSFFYTGGAARSAFATTCTTAATCKSSIYVNFTVR